MLHNLAVEMAVKDPNLSKQSQLISVESMEIQIIRSEHVTSDADQDLAFKRRLYALVAYDIFRNHSKRKYETLIAVWLYQRVEYFNIKIDSSQEHSKTHLHHLSKRS